MFNPLSYDVSSPYKEKDLLGASFQCYDAFALDDGSSQHSHSHSHSQQGLSHPRTTAVQANFVPVQCSVQPSCEWIQFPQARDSLIDAAALGGFQDQRIWSMNGAFELIPGGGQWLPRDMPLLNADSEYWHFNNNNNNTVAPQPPPPPPPPAEWPMVTQPEETFPQPLQNQSFAPASTYSQPSPPPELYVEPFPASNEASPPPSACASSCYSEEADSPPASTSTSTSTSSVEANPVTKKTRRLPCGVNGCKSTFRHYEHLIRHQKIIHSIGGEPKVYVCPAKNCSKSFRGRIDNFKGHLYLHTGSSHRTPYDKAAQHLYDLLCSQASPGKKRR